MTTLITLIMTSELAVNGTLEVIVENSIEALSQCFEFF